MVGERWSNNDVSSKNTPSERTQKVKYGGHMRVKP